MIAATLEQFNAHAMNVDFQRNNMFSIVFATKPNSKTQEAMTNGGNTTEELFTTNNSFVDQIISDLASIKNTKFKRKNGIGEILIGALTPRLMQSMLGEISVGSDLGDYFDGSYDEVGILVHSAKIPDNRLNHEIDKMHNAPNIKITGREFEPLVITFRMDSAALNYRSMNDWINSVEDPVTGLRALPSAVEADIQINLHARNSLPHTAIIFKGAIPVATTSPTMSYEEDGAITTFDVTFAYRVMQMGAIASDSAEEWLRSTGDKINNNNSISKQSRLNGNQNIPPKI